MDSATRPNCTSNPEFRVAENFDRLSEATSQRRKFEHSKPPFGAVSTVPVVVGGDVESEAVDAEGVVLRRELDQTANDTQARQRNASDEVGRDQHVAVDLANVLEERQVELVVIVGLAARVEMHDLEIRRHYRAVLVHLSVERYPFVRPTCESILKPVFRSQALCGTN